MNIKIVCCCHGGIDKSLDPIMLRYPSIFVPVYGGAVYNRDWSDKFFDAMAKDDDGENISWANPLCSEATALYWAYKNIHKFGNPDMIGLCHYRRIFELDYDNLDYNTIYVKRCACPIPEHHTFLGSYWADPDMAILIRDIFFDRFPQYYELHKLLQDEYTFYDKEMFIMNDKEFKNYMDYITQCLRLLLDEAYPIMLKWHGEHPAWPTHKLCFSRGFSYLLEYFAALYFAMLQERGYRLQVAPLTERSSHDNYGHLCVPRRS
jgi:hypothetical protein